MPDAIDGHAAGFLQGLGVRNEVRRVVAARSCWKPEISQVFISWLNAHQPDSSAPDLVEGLVLALAGDAPFNERLDGVLRSDSILEAKQLQLLAAIGLLYKLPATLAEVSSGGWVPRQWRYANRSLPPLSL